MTSNLRLLDKIQSFATALWSYNETTKKLKQGAGIMGYRFFRLKSRNRDAVINAVMPLIAEGTVTLFHDLYESTYQAIEYMVPKTYWTRISVC